MLPVNHKIQPLSVVLQRLIMHRLQNEKIVFTNGCYDILHPGHVDLLSRCKMAGDILVLGLNSDDSVRRQGKTPPRPINPFESRAFVLAHLESVDFVVGFEEDTPLDIIKQIKPHVLIKGGDWALDKIVGAKEVEEAGGRVLSLPLLEGYSTTSLIHKIKKL